jgi:hypothetical protein
MAQDRLDTKQRQGSMGNCQTIDALRFCQSGDGSGAAIPHADIRKGCVLIAIGEVIAGRGVEVNDIDAGSGLPPIRRSGCGKGSGCNRTLL